MNFKEKSLSAYDVFIIVGIGLFAALFAIEKVYNYDLWWHLRSGQWIIDNLAIPRVDPFSFSTEGEPWIYSSWLAGPVLLFLYNLGGVDLLILFKAILIGSAFSAACLYMVRSGVHPFLAAVLLGYAVVVVRFRFLLRPTMIMFPALILVFWSFSTNVFQNKKHYYWFLPFIVVWMNFHASAYIVPVFAFYILLESLIARYAPFNFIDSEVPDIKSAAILLCFSALAVLITPFGMDVPEIMFKRALVEDLLTDKLVVEEHRPLKWGEYDSYWYLMIATAASFIANFRRVRIFHLLVFVGTTILAVTSIRYIGIAGFLCAIVLGINLSRIYSHIPINITLPKKVTAFTGIIILISLGAFSFYDNFKPNKVYKWGLGVNESRYPVKAVEYLQKIGYSGNIYNLWVEGGYLLWHFPEARTLFDGRALPAQFELIDKLNEMNFIELRNYLEANKVGAAIIPTGENAVEVFEALPEYSLHQFDGDYLVFLHEDVSSPLSGESDIVFQHIKPQSYDVSYLDKYIGTFKQNAVETELRSGLKLSENNFILLYQLGHFLQKSDKTEAVDRYIEAIYSDPPLALSHYNLELKAAEFAIKHRLWAKAEEVLDFAVANGKKGTKHYFLLGSVQYKLKKYEKAEDSLRLVLKKEPNQLSAILNLGYICLDTNRPKDAESYFDKALSIAPDSDSASFGYAYSRHLLNKADAPEILNDFVKRFPASKLVPKALGILKEY